MTKPTALALAQANVQAYADTAARNRDAMPIVTAFVDDMRAVFGDLTVIHAAENGRETTSRRGRCARGVVPTLEERKK